MKIITNKHVGNCVIPSKFRQQRGAVLVLALVMLTVLTLIGVSSMSSSSLELKVASNAQQRNTAFQGAQSRLAFTSSINTLNPIDWLIPIDVKALPSTWPVQPCDPAQGCLDGLDWVATAQVRYIDCAAGLGSSMEAGKGFAFRTFEIEVAGETTALTARSIQIGAVRYPVKGCGDEG